MIPGHRCPEERHLSPDRGAHFAPLLHSDGDGTSGEVCWLLVRR
jgi:hypothetical protein